MHDLYRPTISVVIAARDAAPYVGAMLESLFNQTQPPNQVVFYDDGSTDDTASIARGFTKKLPMLTVIEGSSPVGISTARNRANSVATSEYIAVLDADDLFRPETVRRYIEFLSNHPDTDLLYADTRVFHGDAASGKSRHYPTFASARKAIRMALGSPLIPFKHSSMVYRRRAMERLGGYDESLPIKVDVDLFCRFHANLMHVEKLDRTTSCHRKHSRQISTKRIRGIKAYARLLKTYEPDPLVRGLLLSTRVPSELMKLLLRG